MAAFEIIEDLYFDSEYAAKYNEIMGGLFHRGVMKRKGGILYTTVQPQIGFF